MIRLIIILSFISFSGFAQLPEINDPIKYHYLTNKIHVDSLNDKPIDFYLKHKQIDKYSKLYYDSKFAVSDDTLTFSILDSLLTANKETRPFYRFVFNSIINLADGALAEVIGSYGRGYFEDFTCEFIEMRYDPLYQDFFLVWINFIAYDYLFVEKPIDFVNDKVQTLLPAVALYCKSDYDKELEKIREQIITEIKKEIN